MNGPLLAEGARFTATIKRTDAGPRACYRSRDWPALSRLPNPLPLGPFALDEPSPIAGSAGSLDCERGMIAWISVALSHDLCTAECAAH
jgi:hypothetical protein